MSDSFENSEKPNNTDKKISVFMSLVLRHNPKAAGITVDDQGWADVRELIEGISKKTGGYMDMETLERIVAENDKQRYSFNEDRTKIRANQGHSLPYVTIEFEECVPPDILYHGTSRDFLDSIRQKGILKQKRHHVHLSSDIPTAYKVGKRHGKPAVLQIDTKKMLEDGYTFYLSSNKVWLCEHIGWEYVKDNEIIYTV